MGKLRRHVGEGDLGAATVLSAALFCCETSAHEGICSGTASGSLVLTPPSVHAQPRLDRTLG